MKNISFVDRKALDRRERVGLITKPAWLKTRLLAAKLAGAENSFKTNGFKHSLSSFTKTVKSKVAVISDQAASFKNTVFTRAGRFDSIRGSESKLLELRFTNLEKQPSSKSKVAQHYSAT